LQSVPRRLPAEEVGRLERRHEEPPQATVRAWDLPTRLFKWGLVALVAAAWASNKFGAAVPHWHVWNGTAILVLIVFRVLWGFFGGSTARFSAFVVSPRRMFAYLRGQLAGVAPRYLGHNPLGAWMVLALLAVVAAQAMLGLYAADADRLIVEGPLAKTVSDEGVDFAAHWHRVGFNLILALVAIHVATNLAYDLLAKHGLIRAMVTGCKPAADFYDMREAAAGSAARALICLAAAIAIVLGGIFALGGNPLR
jgi:cytochrome b